MDKTFSKDRKKTSWDCMNGWNIKEDDFAEKLDTITKGKYEWDSELAIENLKKYYRNYFEELKENEFDKIIKYLKDNDITDFFEYRTHEIPYKKIVNQDYLYRMCLSVYYAKKSSSESEFTDLIESNNKFINFYDFWECCHSCGRRLNKDIEIYLTALQMAYAQLINKS